MISFDHLHIDLETRSRTNLLTDGMYSYATCPSTQIICMSWAFGDDSPRTWVPGQPFPELPRKHMNAGGICRAFNSGFERLMFECILSREVVALGQLDLEQWQCTAYKARCNALPGSLANCGRALGLSTQKDLRGRDLIRMLCIPQADGTFNKDPVLLQEMYDYCETDVIVESAIDHQIREPSEAEWRDFYVNERINDRGIRVDLDLARAATEYAGEEEADMIDRIIITTQGRVEKARGEKLKEWVVGKITEEQKPS